MHPLVIHTASKYDIISQSKSNLRPDIAVHEWFLKDLSDNFSLFMI